ncbi:MAG: hypothetical protein GX227_10935 [Clostridiaceae bacterium]|jgi:hypothetical protein|nr:hypothetical protein [Clostridiaceae bacterium]
MKKTLKLLLTLLLTVIVFSGSITSVVADDNGHTCIIRTRHEYTFYNFGDDTYHNFTYRIIRECIICNFFELIDSGEGILSHTIRVTDVHLGNKHTYSEKCTDCGYVRYDVTYDCPGNPCIKPYSIKPVCIQ